MFTTTSAQVITPLNEFQELTPVRVAPLDSIYVYFSFKQFNEEFQWENPRENYIIVKDDKMKFKQAFLMTYYSDEYMPERMQRFQDVHVFLVAKSDIQFWPRVDTDPNILFKWMENTFGWWYRGRVINNR